jgi:hypothetical protein
LVLQEFALPDQIARRCRGGDEQEKRLRPRTAVAVGDGEVKTRAAIIIRGRLVVRDVAADQRDRTGADIGDGVSDRRLVCEAARVAAEVNVLRRGIVGDRFPDHRVRRGAEVQVFFEQRIARREVRDERARRNLVRVIVEIRIRAERAFPIVRHPVVVGVKRCGRGVQRAIAAVRRTRIRRTGETLILETGQRSNQHRRHFITQTARMICIQPQRAALRNDFLVGDQRGILRHGNPCGAREGVGHLENVRRIDRNHAPAVVIAVEHVIAIRVPEIVREIERKIRHAVGV